MNRSIWIYLLVMSLVSFIIRVLPVTLIRQQIKNRFIRSLLYYLPFLLVSGIIAGVVVGLVSAVLVQRVKIP